VARELRRARGDVTIRRLQRELVAALIDAGASGPRGAAELDATCAELAERVAARWPAWIDAGTFARYVAARVDPDADVQAALGELHVVDLYLACACARGVAAAHAVFDREYVAELRGAMRTVDASRDFADEVLQLLREKMLVVHDGATRIESYSGHGPLGGWLRVSALRIALSLRRRDRPGSDDEELAALLDPAPTAEVTVLAARLGADLRAALAEAVREQPARTRAVLRLYYADGRGVEEIGSVYRVHASTVSRWLAKARTDILALVRARLVERLAATASEVDSLLAHAASVEISFGTVLGAPSASGSPGSTGSSD
jgi:RNA polymerase sigma-70 factor (ECF subfamily)